MWNFNWYRSRSTENVLRFLFCSIHDQPYTHYNAIGVDSKSGYSIFSTAYMNMTMSNLTT